jgi:phenylacetate-coenzyme A ligase PaaK-like adenylate-forming protein
LKEIRGRACDYVELPSGKQVPFLQFNVLFEQMGGTIKEFQIEQQSLTEIKLRVVLDNNVKPEHEKRVLENLVQSVLSDEVTVSVETVSAIHRLKSGKFRYIIPLPEN